MLCSSRFKFPIVQTCQSFSWRSFILHSNKIIFLTITDSGYSRSWTLYNGLRQIGKEVNFEKVDTKNLIRNLLAIKKKYEKNSVYIIMSPSQVLVPLSRLIFGRRLVLDAGWSLFEGTTISRGHHGFFGWIAAKNYLIDLTASHLSRLVILESCLQRDYYRRLFFLPKRKCTVIYTGLDEREFDSAESKDLLGGMNLNRKVVLFRGKFNPEAGLDVLAKATHEIREPEILFWVVAPGISSKIEFSQNTIIDTKYYSKKEIAAMNSLCDLSLGQLSAHPRLNRTIPHKAFESAYLGVPYLSARNDGILELFEEGFDIECFEPGNSFDLASKIRLLLENDTYRKRLGENMKHKYNMVCEQTFLAEELLKILGEKIG